MLPRMCLLLLLPGIAFAAAPHSQRVDQYGEPLPPGAIARYGNPRVYLKQVTHLCFSPDDKHLAASGEKLVVWDLSTGTSIRYPHLEQFHDARLTFASDGAHVVQSNGELHTFDPRTGRLRHTVRGKLFDAAPTQRRTLSTQTSSGNLIVTVILGQDQSTIKLRSADGDVVGTSLMQGNVNLEFSRVKPGIWQSFLTSGELVQWQLRDGAIVRRSQLPITSHALTSESMFFSPKFTFCVKSNDMEKLDLFNLVSGKQTSLGLELINRRTVAFGPDEQTMATVEDRSEKAKLLLWNTATGKVRRTIAIPPRCTSIAFTPDGRSIAVCASCMISIIEVSTGKVRQTFTSIRDLCALELHFSGNGRRLLASGFGSQHVFCLDTGRVVYQLEKEQFGVGTLSHDGRWLAWSGSPFGFPAGSAKSTVLSLHDLTALDSATPARQFDVPTRGITALAFADNGTLLVGCFEGCAFVWDVSAQLHPPIAELRRQHWEQLASGSAATAEQAIIALCKTPDTTVRLIDEQIHKTGKLGSLRAIEVLERIATREAQAILKRLASGAPNASLTREAKASLDRLSVQ